ncbi:MAG TPA: hypothetical protein VIK18_01090 [Pirellulales bacterium]
MEAKQKQLAQDVQTAERRMAVERDDDRYEAIASQHDLLKKDLQETELEIDSKRQINASVPSLAEDVTAAMSLLDQILGLTGDDYARESLPDLVRQLGVRIGLTFAAGIKGTKRKCSPAAS